MTADVAEIPISSPRDTIWSAAAWAHGRSVRRAMRPGRRRITAAKSRWPCA